MTGRSIAEMIDSITAGADGHETDDEQQLEKSAAAEGNYEYEGPTDADIIEVEKLADALDALAEGIGENPQLALAAKLAADQAFAGKSVGMPPKAGDHPRVVANKDGRGDVQLGKARQRVQKHPLKGEEPGGASTHVATNEGDSSKYAPDFGQEVQKTAEMQKRAEREALRRSIFSKLGIAGVDGSEIAANISGKPMTNPTLHAWKGDETAGSSPAGSDLISSNERAISFKKRDATKRKVKQLKKVLNERAMSKSTDKVLHSAFDHTDEAGAKYASAMPVRDHLASLLAKRTGR